MKTKSHEEFGGDEMIGPKQIDQTIQVDVLARASDMTEACPPENLVPHMCF